MRRGRNALAITAAFLIALQALGCASFDPKPLEEVPFRERAQTQNRDGLQVTVAVPSRQEAQQLYGVDVGKKGLQPIWIQIENDSDIPYGLLLSSVDPMYFSPYEAARRSGFRFRLFTNGKVRRHFGDLQMTPYIPRMA
jgi:hypothetical protein